MRYQTRSAHCCSGFLVHANYGNQNDAYSQCDYHHQNDLMAGLAHPIFNQVGKQAARLYVYRGERI